MIRIISAKDGFRRCNVAHSREITDYPDGFFSKKELKLLGDEPMLTVQEIPGKPVTEASAPDLNKLGVKKLKETCDKLTIAYPDDADKPALIALIEKHTAEPTDAE